MNDYLKKAFDKLTIREISEILMWLLDKKRDAYEGILSDTDCHNNLILLDGLEEKLGTILVNLVQQEDRNGD